MEKHQPRKMSYDKAQYVLAHDIAWHTPYSNKKGTTTLGEMNIEHLRNVYKLLKARNVAGELAVLMAKVHLVIERKEFLEKGVDNV